MACSFMIPNFIKIRTHEIFTSVELARNTPSKINRGRMGEENVSLTSNSHSNSASLKQSLSSESSLLVIWKVLIPRSLVSKDVFKCRMQTMAEILAKLSEKMNVADGYYPVPPDRSHLLPLLPKTQDELPPRKMKDSFEEVLIPLRTDLALQTKYCTSRGHIRIGRLLEDIDFLSVWIALKHIQNPRQGDSKVTPYTIVTALVEKMTFVHLPQVVNNLRLYGHVVLTGRTSLSVLIKVDSMVNNRWDKVTEVSIVLAARDCNLTKGAFVNKIIPETQEEVELYKLIQGRVESQRNAQKKSLLSSSPSEEEQLLVHTNFLNTLNRRNSLRQFRILPENSMWLADTKISLFIHPLPENRNHQNTVFGGFLMRLATELSWACGFKFTGAKPTLRGVDEIIFSLPISIDSFVNMTCEVTYSDENYFITTVHCERFEMESKNKVLTNIFHYIYHSDKPTKHIVPFSYADSMIWIEGRRRYMAHKEWSNVK